jgi:hypothetical protein
MKKTKAKKALEDLSYHLVQEAQDAASESDISVQPKEIMSYLSSAFSLHQLVEGVRDQAVVYSGMAIGSGSKERAKEWADLADKLSSIIR